MSEAPARQIWLRTDPDPGIRANGFYRRLGWRSFGVQEDGQVHYVKSSVREPG